MSSRLVLLCLVVLAARAHADPKSDAKQHVSAATAAHGAGHYDEALKELTLAYALDPQPELLYAIGQVHMKLGDCDAAKTFYNRFLATKPDAKASAVAQKAIATCVSHPRPVDAKPDEPTPKPDPPKPDEPKLDEPKPVVTPVVVVPQAEVRPWYRDWIGDVLVGAGVVALGASAFEYRSATRTRDDADHASSYGEYRSTLDRANTDQNIAIGLAAGGGVLVIAGIIHYVASDNGEHGTSGVAVVPIARGQLFVWSARF